MRKTILSFCALLAFQGAGRAGVAVGMVNAAKKTVDKVDRKVAAKIEEIRLANLNWPPVLSWTGEPGYASGGVAPENGQSTDFFEYRVKYRDVNNDVPYDGYPKVHILSGGVELSSSPFSMVKISGSYSSGAIYGYSATLEAGTDYSYYFEAQDMHGEAAVEGDPLTPVDAPNVTINQAPTLAWTGESNYTAGGLYPEAATSTDTYVYRVTYADADGDAPLAGHPRVHIKKGGVEISSSPFAMAQVSNDYLAGAVYGYSTTLVPGADYTYYFEGRDFRNAAASGAPVTPSTGPWVIGAVSVAKWTFAGNWGGSSPAIAPDGTLYLGGLDHKLSAINPDGSEKWTFNASSFSNSSPAIGADGTVYAGAQNNYFYAVNPDGSLKWDVMTSSPVNSSPAIGADGTVYTGSDDGSLYAFTPAGTKKWSFATGGKIRSSPAVSPEGITYAGSNDGYLYAVNPDGTLKWRVLTSSPVNSSPAIGADGTIYLGSGDGFLYAFNPDNSPKWAFAAGSAINSSPAIAPDGTIYMGADDGKIYALTPAGTLKWAVTTSSPVTSSPAIDTEGTVYAGSDDGKLYALAPDGTLKWSYQTGGRLSSSPGIGADGLVYAASSDGRLYAIYCNTGLAASAWPKFHHDQKNTGRYYLEGNGNPEISAVTAHATAITTLKITTITATASDPDGDTLTYWWSATGGSFIGGGSQVNWVAPSADATYIINCTVVDGKGGAAQKSVNVRAGAPGAVKWEFSTGFSLYSSPAIGTDGTVYVGADNGNLYAINPDGSQKWAFPAGNPINSSPAIGPDGTIYAAAHDGQLYAVNPDGSQKWVFFSSETFLNSCPAVSTENVVYIGSSMVATEDGKLYAVNPDGSQKWALVLGPVIHSSPAIAPDGTVYIGAASSLYAVRPDGTVKWLFTTGGWVRTAPAIAGDGTIYFGSYDNYLYAVTDTGAAGVMLWAYLTAEWRASSPAIAPDGSIYAGAQDKKLYAFASDGSVKWSFYTPDSSVDSSPALGADGTIYVGSNNRRLYALIDTIVGGTPTGVKKWDYETASAADSAPAIYEDGTVYFQSNNKLYAFFGESALAVSPWPKFRRDQFNSGRR